MSDDLSKTILLDGLKHEQAQCLRFIADARRNMEIKEGLMLQWALSETVTVYRELRNGTLDYHAALERYCEVAHVTTAYDTAVYMALEFVPYEPTTAQQIKLCDDLLGIVRKDAA